MMKAHAVTLVLTTEPSEEEAGKLSGGCDDGTLSTIAGVLQIHFQRAALSFPVCHLYQDSHRRPVDPAKNLSSVAGRKCCKVTIRAGH